MASQHEKQWLHGPTNIGVTANHNSLLQKLAIWEPSSAQDYKAINKCCRLVYMLCCLFYLNTTFCTQKTAQIRAMCVFCQREDVALRKTCMLCDQYKQSLQTGIPTAIPTCVFTILLRHACLSMGEKCCCCQVHPHGMMMNF